MVNFWNQRRIANPSHLLLSGRGRSRPAGSIGLCGGSYCRRVSSVCDRQPTLDCQSSGRVPVIYTAAPRQLQTSLHCSRLLRIFAAGIEVWCNGSTTDFGSVCPGSNPGTSTEKVRPLDRTFLIHSNFQNVYVSRGLQCPCNVEPVASRRPQALTFRYLPRRSRPAGSIGRCGGSYCRRTSSVRGRQSNTIACEGCLWPEATRHGPPPEVYWK